MIKLGLMKWVGLWFIYLVEGKVIKYRMLKQSQVMNCLPFGVQLKMLFSKRWHKIVTNLNQSQLFYSWHLYADSRVHCLTYFAG